MISYETVLRWGQKIWIQFATTSIILPMLPVWASSFLARFSSFDEQSFLAFLSGELDASRKYASAFAYDSSERGQSVVLFKEADSRTLRGVALIRKY